MDNLVVDNFINFYRTLGLKNRIEVLNRLTHILNNDVNNRGLVIKKEENKVDELFGMWEEESELNEHTIIDRTASDKAINLN